MRPISVDDPQAIASAAAVSGVAPVFFNVLPVVVGALVVGRGLDNAQVGILASLYMAGHTLATLALILLVRSFNWRLGVSFFATVQILGFGLAASTQRYEIIGALLFVAGLGGGGLFATSMTSMGDTLHPDRNYGLATLAQTLLPAAVAFLLPIYVIPRWGVAGAFVVLALLAASCIIWARWLPTHGKESLRHDKSNHQILPSSWISLATALLFVTGLAAMWTFFERIGDAGGINPSFTGLVISGSLIAGGAGSLVPVVLGERWGRTLPISIASGLLLLCIWLLSQQLTAALYAIAGLLFFFGWTVSIIYQLGRLAARDNTGYMVAAIPAIIGVGSTLGPMIGGFLVTDNDFRSLYWFATFSTVTTIVIVILNRRKSAHPAISMGTD